MSDSRLKLTMNYLFLCAISVPGIFLQCFLLSNIDFVVEHLCLFWLLAAYIRVENPTAAKDVVLLKPLLWGSFNQTDGKICGSQYLPWFVCCFSLSGVLQL